MTNECILINPFGLHARCMIQPDWDQQEEALKDMIWKPTTETEWTAVLEFHLMVRPNCRIGSITPANRKEGDKTGDTTH